VRAWLMPAAAVAAVVVIVLINGVPRGNDWSFEMVRVVEMRAAFATGQVPPFWAPDEYRGFGSPIFLFYAPLFAWIAAVISMTGAIVLCVIVAAVVMRAAAMEVATTAMQRLAVIAFVLHPYFLGDIWVRNANAELLALAFLPGVVAGAIARDARRRFWWTALSFTGVMLAHNLTALVACAMSIAIAAYVHRAWRPIAPTCAGILVALGMTAFFWVPAMAVKRLGVREDALLTGHFDFHRNFPPLTSFFMVDPPREYFGGGTLGVVMLAVVIVAAMFKRPADVHDRRVVQACAIGAAVLLFLMLPVSAFLWEHVPLMPFLQFPWRLAGPLAVVSILGFVTAMRGRESRWLEAFVIVLAALAALPMFLAYRPAPKLPFTPAAIRAQGLRSTVGDDYLPRDADKRVIGEPVQPEGFVVFPTWAFPVWRVSVDGQRADVVPMAGGLAGVRVSPGQHDVRLTLVEPRIRTITKIISAIAMMLLAWFALRHPGAGRSAAQDDGLTS